MRSLNNTVDIQLKGLFHQVLKKQMEWGVLLRDWNSKRAYLTSLW